MNLRNIITGSDPEDEKLSASVGLPPYRRWYCYGGRSPGILLARLRNKYRPISRTRWAWQRLTRGHDDTMLWSLNWALAKLTVEGCNGMLAWGHGHPMGMKPEEWDQILTEIRDGFQAWLDDDSLSGPGQAKFDEGMALYAKWFGALWD